MSVCVLCVTFLFSLAQQMTYIFMSVGGSFEYTDITTAFQMCCVSSETAQTREIDDSYTIKKKLNNKNE